MQSIWQREFSDNAQDEKNVDINNLKTDVLIIGGGITGILTAHALKKRGIENTVIDSGSTHIGVTAYSNAKITPQHGLTYSKLYRTKGEAIAKEYAIANSKAVEEYARLIKTENIDCDFERVSSCLYATESMAKLVTEQKYAEKSGLNYEFINKTNLPDPILAVLECANQAQFNPLKFVRELSQNLNVVFNTTALEIKDGKVITNRGTIFPKKIVIATHMPFLNIPGFYFMKMEQEIIYLIATENTLGIEDHFLAVDGNNYSLRKYKDKLIISGNSHRVGKNIKGGKYDEIEQFARSLIPNAPFICRWSTEDCMTGDGIPYIGKLSKKTENIYVATGYNKWGFTNAMTASHILTDLIMGRKPEYSIFSPSRLWGGVTPKILASNTLHSIVGLGSSMFVTPQVKPKDIPSGTGDIVVNGYSKAAMYRDKEGKEHFFDAHCPHMGCQVKWNMDTSTWDCPCHGSRFYANGGLISGPSKTNLEKKETQ